jgi:hypothetical protein
MAVADPPNRRQPVQGVLAQGVQPPVVMATFGHSQISITMDTYSHVMRALSVEVAQKMNAACLKADWGSKVGSKLTPRKGGASESFESLRKSW